MQTAATTTDPDPAVHTAASPETTASTIESTPSADGTRIGWERVGRGPALVVLHGGMRAGKHYRALAAALASRYSVLLVDRRGRGHSGAATDTDGIATEVADLAAVLAATGAERVFGHSAGAMIALQAARQLPIRQLALYEPPDRTVPTWWMPAFAAAITAGDAPRAMALVLKGLQMGPQWVPLWLMALPLRVLRHTQAGKEMVALLKTMPRDLYTLRSIDHDPSSYAALGCRTLVLDGTASPQYLRKAAAALAKLVPGAELVSLPGLSHNAPDMDAPDRVAAQLLRFFD